MEKRKRDSQESGGSKKSKVEPKKGGSKGGKPKPQPKSKGSKLPPQPQPSTSSGGATEPDPINNPITWPSSPRKWKRILPDNHGMFFLSSAGLFAYPAGLYFYSAGLVSEDFSADLSTRSVVRILRRFIFMIRRLISAG